MKCQSLFSGKKKNNIAICRLLRTLLIMLSFKIYCNVLLIFACNRN